MCFRIVREWLEKCGHCICSWLSWCHPLLCSSRKHLASPWACCRNIKQLIKMPLKYSVPSFWKGEQGQDGVLGHVVLCLGWTQTFKSFVLVLCEGCGWIHYLISAQTGSVCRWSAIMERGCPGFTAVVDRGWFCWPPGRGCCYAGEQFSQGDRASL